MKKDIEEAKALLMGTFFLRMAVMNLNFRHNELEPEYPHRFWHVQLCKKYEIEKDWDVEHAFDVDTLEEAIARGIIWEPSTIHYETCELPSNLQKHWKYYNITVQESVRRKEKWGEKSEDVRARTLYKILLTRGWTEDYDEGAWKLETALAFVPKRYYEMVEGHVPYHWDYHNNEDPKASDYPAFKYDGHYFRTTYYIPSQKCVCGISDTYHNDYEGDNSVKVEVWHAKCYEKDHIHYDGSHIIYNDQIMEAGDFRQKLDGVFKDKEIDELKQLFPDAKGYNGPMESRNFGREKCEMSAK
jgi:hypothetical protein